MKKKVFVFIPLSIVILFLTGCASYKAASLNILSSEMIQTSYVNTETVLISAMAFNKADCKKYLDRDVIKKGYQPIQICIQNNSDKNYLFSLNRISLSCARPEEVAEKVHTSTVGRAVGYGAAAWFTCGLFAIPAVVDGVKSAEANEALDNDFSAKTARDQTIFSHSHLNKLIFVPVNEYQQNFNITLIEQKSNKQKIFNIIIN